MKTDIVKQYVSLRNELEKEKTHLESRLEQINEVLKGSVIRLSTGSTGVLQTRGRRKMGAARARIPAAATARWAKRGSSVAVSKPARKRRRKVNAAARAKLSAAAKARWAKAKAAGKKTL